MEKRIVFKFGTNVLRNSEGVLDENRIKGFAKSIAEIKKNGSDVLVITSGAVGLGGDVLTIKVDEPYQNGFHFSFIIPSF